MTHGFPCRRPAHSVYVFGFSRGAYTARARWHALASLMRRGSENLLPYAVEKYTINGDFKPDDYAESPGAARFIRETAGSPANRSASSRGRSKMMASWRSSCKNSTTCTSPLAASVEKVRTCSSRLRFQAAAVGCGNRSTRNVPDAGRPRWIQGRCSTCWVIRSSNVARSTRSCAQWLPAT
jgi:Uncharacterized alpha/beta hydrolase domain (DUF2235)